MANLTPHTGPSTTTLTNPTGLCPFHRRNSSNTFNNFHRLRVGKLDLRGPNRADDMRPVVPGGLFQRFPGVLRAALIGFFRLPAVFMMVTGEDDLLLLFFFLFLLTTILLFLLFGAFRLWFFFFNVAPIFGLDGAVTRA